MNFGSAVAGVHYGSGAFTNLWSFTGWAFLWEANLDTDPQPEVVMVNNTDHHTVSSTG